MNNYLATYRSAYGPDCNEFAIYFVSENFILMDLLSVKVTGHEIKKRILLQ